MYSAATDSIQAILFFRLWRWEFENLMVLGIWASHENKTARTPSTPTTHIYLYRVPHVHAQINIIYFETHVNASHLYGIPIFICRSSAVWCFTSRILHRSNELRAFRCFFCWKRSSPLVRPNRKIKTVRLASILTFYFWNWLICIVPVSKKWFWCDFGRSGGKKTLKCP